MPRYSRSSKTSFAKSTSTLSRPLVKNTIPTQQTTKPGIFSGFGNTLVQGMAFGAGS